MSRQSYDEPSHVEAGQTVVVVRAPAGVAGSLTPAAAAEISDRLLQGAVTAHGQQLAAETAAARRKRSS